MAILCNYAQLCNVQNLLPPAERPHYENQRCGDVFLGRGVGLFTPITGTWEVGRGSGRRAGCTPRRCCPRGRRGGGRWRCPRCRCPWSHAGHQTSLVRQPFEQQKKYDRYDFLMNKISLLAFGFIFQPANSSNLEKCRFDATLLGEKTTHGDTTSDNASPCCLKNCAPMHTIIHPTSPRAAHTPPCAKPQHTHTHTQQHAGVQTHRCAHSHKHTGRET